MVRGIKEDTKTEGLRYRNTCQTLERRPLSKEQIIQLSKEVGLVFSGQMPEGRARLEGHGDVPVGTVVD